MKKQHNWDLEQTWNCFKDAGIDKSYYETYGWKKCGNITNNVFLATTLKMKLNCLEENNAYINPMQRCKMQHDGHVINMYSCFKHIVYPPPVDILGYEFDWIMI